MQALLSDNWHSVRWLKPKLREGVRVYHRIFRGRPVVLLFDPSSNRFHRLSVEAYSVLELFDGRQSLDDIWQHAALASQGNATQQDAIGQHELVQLVSQLYSGDLLQSQVTPDASEVLQRFDRQRKAKLKQLLLNPLSIKLPLLYPEPWLAHQVGLANRLFSTPMLWLWLCLVLPAALIAGMHWSELTDNLSDRILSGQNLLIAWFTYPIVKALHEWGHAMAVKKWGGRVREAGLMLLVFTPVPYVDATDAYGFASKWQRALVAAAGVMAELMLGALAVYVWVLVEPGNVRAIAYNVILIAGVSTLLVNGNPLMRYDGYFVLSEWLEIPNLAQRATKYWAYLSDRYLFGANDAKSPALTAGEARIFFIYGAIAPVYRLTIALGLAWFVAEEYFIFGTLIALAGLWSSLVLPCWKGWQHLRSSNSLAGRHDTALKRTLVALAISLAIFLGVPLPFYAVSEGVIWVPEKAIVRAGSAGLMTHPQVLPDQILQAGEVITELENPQLHAELETTAGLVAELDTQLRQAQTQDAAKIVNIQRQLDAAHEKLLDAQHKVYALALIAGDKGRWVFVNGTEPAGQYFKRGQTVGYVVDGPTKVLRVAVSQEDSHLIRERTQGVSVRLARRPWIAYNAIAVRPVGAGQNQLVSPALGSEGGGLIPVDPSKPEGTTSLQRIFECELELEQADPVAAFGDRAHIRFDLGWTPLAQQLFLRLRQAFLARLYV